MTDVFVFDRARRVTRLMSTNANNVSGDGHSRNPAMSLNGRFVVFESFANNLAGGNPGTTLPDLRHLPARPRHRRGRRLRRERRHRHAARQPQSVRRQPDQPQHRAVDHLRRPLRRVRDRRRQRQGGRRTAARIDSNSARDIFICDRLAGVVTRRLSEADRRPVPGRQRRAGAQRQRQPAAVPDPGRQRRRRIVAGRRRSSPPSPATASRRRARSLADHRHAAAGRRAAAAAHRQHRGPGDQRRRQHHRQHGRTRSRDRRGRAGDGGRGDAARRATARPSSPACRPTPARPPAARSSTSRAPTSSTARRRCTGERHFDSTPPSSTARCCGVTAPPSPRLRPGRCRSASSSTARPATRSSTPTRPA